MVYIQTLIHTPAGSLTVTSQFDSVIAEQESRFIAEYYRAIYGKSVIYQYVMNSNAELLAVVEYK